MRKFFLVFRSVAVPTFSVVEGVDLLDAITRFKEASLMGKASMPDIVLAFDLNPNSESVDALEATVRKAVASHIGIGGISSD